MLIHNRVSCPQIIFSQTLDVARNRYIILNN